MSRKARPLLIHFDDATDTDRTEVYARLGSPPTRQTFDARFDANGADHRVAVPFAAPGTWYVLVYGDHVASASNFTLLVEAPPVATLGVTPNYGGVGEQSQVTITGLGFVPGTQFDLVPVGGGAAIPAEQVSIDSTTQASATFDLTGATLGDYDVRATLPTGPSNSLPGAFAGRCAGGKQLSRRASSCRRQSAGTRVATLYVEYENTGTMPMAAPILILQSGDPDNSDRPLLTLDQSRVTAGFWTSAIPDGFAHSVQIYASGAAPGVLQPGERIRVPVYYAGLQQPWDFSDTRRRVRTARPRRGRHDRDRLAVARSRAAAGLDRRGRLARGVRQPASPDRSDLGRLRPHAQRQRPLPRPARRTRLQRRAALRLRAAAGDRHRPARNDCVGSGCRRGVARFAAHVRPLVRQHHHRALPRRSASAAAGMRPGSSSRKPSPTARSSFTNRPTPSGASSPTAAARTPTSARPATPARCARSPAGPTN